MQNIPAYLRLHCAHVHVSAHRLLVNYCLLQAVQDASVEELLAAAAVTHNSLCGLYPLAVGLQALYGCPSSSSGSDSITADKPQLLLYSPAHMIYPRCDSTGFASLVVYAACRSTVQAAD
jgi:hypothetical protein